MELIALPKGKPVPILTSCLSWTQQKTDHTHILIKKKKRVHFSEVTTAVSGLQGKEECCRNSELTKVNTLHDCIKAYQYLTTKDFLL